MTSLAEVEGGTETVLFVEDEETLRDLVQVDLSVQGYTVILAGNGPEAVDAYRTHKDEIALVVCDFGLPGFSGRDVLNKLRTINPRLKLVLASGYLDPDEKSEIFGEGAHEFIQKPYTPNELLLKSGEHLMRRRDVTGPVVENLRAFLYLLPVRADMKMMTSCYGRRNSSPCLMHLSRCFSWLQSRGCFCPPFSLPGKRTTRQISSLPAQLWHFLLS